jgi:hypothetical protein
MPGPLPRGRWSWVAILEWPAHSVAPGSRGVADGAGPRDADDPGSGLAPAPVSYAVDSLSLSGEPPPWPRSTGCQGGARGPMPSRCRRLPGTRPHAGHSSWDRPLDRPHGPRAESNNSIGIVGLQGRSSGCRQVGPLRSEGPVHVAGEATRSRPCHWLAAGLPVPSERLLATWRGRRRPAVPWPRVGIAPAPHPSRVADSLQP